ncbi:MAG: FIST C-terminal domain-containing protein [Candidatus Omnitrophica bacterium]|nr:FIST C-terminal domain-containing protein [Candidatus Omnitrophota bacterium]
MYKNMSTLTGTGISTKLDSFAAGKEAALNAYYQIEKNYPNILIIFISAIYNQHETIKGVRSIIRDTPIIGCSSVGSISNYGFHQNSVAVSIISSDSINFFCGIGDKISANSRLAGSKAAIKAFGSIKKHNPKQAYMMFSDSISGNSADILRGAQEILGTCFPIIGGGACNKSRSSQTYQYADNEILTDSVVGVIISGTMVLGIGQSSSWQPIGKPHKITKAKFNIIKEIDRKPAVKIYEEYFEKSFEEIKNDGIFKLGINYPLGLRQTDKNKEYITRVPLMLENNGSFVLNADIREGENISLMISDKELIVESAKKAAEKALSYIKNTKIKFAIMFSDISRFLLLKNDAYKEIDMVKKIIGMEIPILGCYTLGEYGLLNAAESAGQYCFNNHSVSITLFSE